MEKYVVTEEDVKSFAYRPSFENEEGLSFCYEAVPSSIKNVLPPCLKYVDSVVHGHIVEVRDSQIGAPFMELALYVNAEHNGTVQPYVLATLVHGPGAENAMIAGSRIGAIPVKIADEILCRKRGNRIYAKAVRHGAAIFEIEASCGAYNEPNAAGILNDKTNETISEAQWGRKFRLSWAEDEGFGPEGVTRFADTRLCSISTETVKTSHEPAEILGVNVVSTPDDPYGVLAMIRPLGAAWEGIRSFTVLGTKVAEMIDAAENMPYFMAGRFDRSMMIDHGKRYARTLDI